MILSFGGKIADKKFGSLFVDSPLTIVGKKLEENIPTMLCVTVTPEKTANGIKLIKLLFLFFGKDLNIGPEAFKVYLILMTFSLYIIMLF